jgi:anionic cell wall polymer biosynthesis LytR-Cps2A-Psr (LCP) family protein
MALAAILALPVTSLGVMSGPAVQPAGPEVSYGKDGRFTILLLGSDYRDDLYGERMDVVIVITIDPATKRVGAVSIPRDTVYIPRAGSNGGGTSGSNRINAMYSLFYRRPGLAHRKVDLAALVRFKQDVAATLDTEIDNVAMTRFAGITDLVDRIGGVDVRITQAVTDGFYKSPGTPQGVRGAYFPVSDSYHLNGGGSCYPKPKRCHNALIYARSRHGTSGSGVNSDFARARRQHGLVMAGANKIVANGVDSLPALVDRVKGRIWTDLPRTLGAATQLYDLVNGATLGSRDGKVFAPNKWAYTDSSTSRYTFRLYLSKVRGWINRHFGP